MTKPKRKRLVRGKDWHAWAWKAYSGELVTWAFHDKPKTGTRWVRVKFVEVKP